MGLKNVAQSCFLLLVPLVVYHVYLSHIHANSMKSLSNLREPVQSHQVTRASVTLIGEPKEQRQPLIHVSYVHYLDTNDTLSVENFKFFMFFALMPCHPKIFFTLILNKNDPNKSLANNLTNLLGSDLYTKVQNCFIIKPGNGTLTDTNDNLNRNIQIIQRENKPGGDLCAQVEFMKTEFWRLYEGVFKYYFFINSSVRGPFLPAYYLKEWWEMFTDLFEKYNKTATVGSYLSCQYNPHVQSFMMVVDSRGLALLKNTFRCPEDRKGVNWRIEWIIDTEVKLGKLMLEAGYELRSLISAHADFENRIDESICPNINPAIKYPIALGEHTSLFPSET